MFTTEDKNRFKPHLVEIEENPVSPLGRKILWAIVLFMLLALIWLFVGKTDVVVSARSEVVPVGDVKVLQALSGGAIKKIYVKEGDAINKGDPLIEIDPTVEESNIESKKANAMLLSLEIEKLHSLINDTPFKVPADVDTVTATLIMGMHQSEKEALQSQQLQLQQQIRQVQEQIRAIKSDKARASEMYRMGLAEQKRMKSVLDIIAKNDYYRVQKENAGYRNDIDRKSHEIAALEDKLSELKMQKISIVKNFKSKLYSTLAEKTKELTLLRSDIETITFKKKKQIITSPVDGVVAKLAVHTLGGVVSPAEKLMSIVPEGVPMQIKAIVENKDIGFITEGMDVAIKIDTFDYQKYGLFKAKVEKISPNAIEDEKLGLVYEVFIKPETTYLEVEGKKRYLTPGMSATAELKVGERRIIEFFIYPLIKYYDEGVSVR
jgi:hemolysin D